MSAPSFGANNVSPTVDQQTGGTCMMEGSQFIPTRHSQLYRAMVLGAPDPNSALSYQLAKHIYLEHPLGRKLVELPINLAFSQDRYVTGIDDMVRQQFEDTYKQLRVEHHIKNHVRHSRIYGMSTLYDKPGAGFRVFDPLITAGSLVGNLNPLADDYLDPTEPEALGNALVPGCSNVFRSGTPIYLAYMPAAYGFTGQSVYYNTYGLLTTFLMSMTTDELVTQKAGVFVAKMRQATSAVNRLVQKLASWKANLLKEAVSYNVLAIEEGESIETLDLTNTATAMGQARSNVLDNLASAADIPAILLKSETLNQGFGEGVEDSKVVADFVTRFRKEMESIFDFIIPRVQKAAWTEEFYASFVDANPEYQGVPYNVAFNEWCNSFRFEWPNFLVEPDSEKVKRAQQTYEAALNIFEKFNAGMSAENRRRTAQWIVDMTQEDEMKVLFPRPLVLSFEEGEDFEEAQPTEVRGTERENTDNPIGENPGSTKQEIAPASKPVPQNDSVPARRRRKTAQQG